VKDSRPTEDGASIRRRRQCEACGARFTTFERVQLRDLTVVKKSGEREPFDRAKLERVPSRSPAASATFRRADRAADHLDPAPARNPRRRGRDQQIGEAVMDGLKALDHVAYIRFASVYKDFSEPGDFAQIAGAVGDGSCPPPVIVLVRPQLGENIGKAARAMLNFGLTEMRLVAHATAGPTRPRARPRAAPTSCSSARGYSTASRARSPTARQSTPRPFAAATW
jgi:transcriptional repressor NrdR